ncbi:fumarylacetoacetate hydrolase family protein [Thermogymnomonas acidicola]|uniref:fumarylacetoacetate hydrolase family protein n=1 Tax=Thermogymnomonas acidicola TaxID=399579 RepID=UPI001396B693|nr:fumarylacetoacetate hydrolase family protein [Thermogymnomonas acidicola]
MVARPCRPPVQGPDKVILAAINYKTHANEQSFKGMEDPFFFTKFPSCISGPEDPIVIPRSSSMVDYEIELALVIGKRSKYVSEREAMDSVFGYMVLNDVSFRDYQLGKDLKSPPPTGPQLGDGQGHGHGCTHRPCPGDLGRNRRPPIRCRWSSGSTGRPGRRLPPGGDGLQDRQDGLLPVSGDNAPARRHNLYRDAGRGRRLH